MEARKRALVAAATLALTLAAGALAWAWSPGLTADHNAAAERQLERLEQATNQAVGYRNGDALNQLLGDDFVFVDTDGTVLDKHGYIDAVVTGPPSTGAIGDLRFRIYGNTGLVVGRFTPGDGTPGVRYIATWVRRSGRWCTIALQLSPLGP